MIKGLLFDLSIRKRVKNTFTTVPVTVVALFLLYGLLGPFLYR